MNENYFDTQEAQEVEHFDAVESPTVDEVLYGDDWVEGYKDGQSVIRIDKVVDRKAIVLRDESGKVVTHKKSM